MRYRMPGIVWMVMAVGSGALSGRAESVPASKGEAHIGGTVHSVNKVVRVAAVDRQFADVLKTSLPEPRDPFFYEGHVDAGTGAFQIEHLLPGRSYDLIVWTVDGHGAETRWEGVAMDYHREVRPGAAATAEDRRWLEDFVKNTPSFYDKSRVLHMAADHQHATLLVELARTRDFHGNAGGEVIYRVELWYFENLFGGWAKDKNTERVMVRRRAKGSALEKNWQFLPGLGGVLASDAGAAVDVVLPAKADGRNGLAGALP